MGHKNFVLLFALAALILTGQAAAEETGIDREKPRKGDVVYISAKLTRGLTSDQIIMFNIPYDRMECTGTHACYWIAEPCDPFVFRKQTTKKTYLRSGRGTILDGLLWRLDGDWRGATHLDRKSCLDAIETAREESYKPRPMLGLRLEETTKWEQKGLLVKSIVSGLPADDAGMRLNDLLVGIDDTPVSTIAELHDALEERVGRFASIVILRRGDETRLEVWIAKYIHHVSDNGSVSYVGPFPEKPEDEAQFEVE